MANKDTFPSGMKALGDYALSKGDQAAYAAQVKDKPSSSIACAAGLKYGLYSDAGAQTCAGYVRIQHLHTCLQTRPQLDSFGAAAWQQRP